MNNKPVPVTPVAIRYGLFLGAALIAFFLIMRVISLYQMVELSFLNDIIRVIFIVMAIKAYKSMRGGHINYLPGLGLGALVSLVGSVIIGLFMFIYSSLIDQDFLNNVNFEEYFGYDLSPFMLFWHVTIWGAGIGIILSFIAMQFYKSPDHKLSNE